MKREVSYAEIEKDIADLNKALKTIKKNATVEKALNNTIGNVRFQAAELKKHEREIADSKAKIESILNGIPIGLITFKFNPNPTERKWNYVNPALEKMLSFSKEEMLGKGIADQPCLAPDTMSVVREVQKKYGEGVA